ncbi:YbhN family protein [Gymnodinialimonas hymeniacidonis]|uniref:lysylphosphatidylglycerol synthase transmembrane domain-containing protein n=1 Tax=Gymnodinialimonas hymeniacidonis TaxID=3126508 RepID=UPI0034C6CB85
MGRAYPKWLNTVLQLLTLAALAYLLSRTVDWSEAWTLLSGAHLLPLLAAALLLTAQTVLSAMRWRLTAARLGISLPMGFAVREYYLSQVVNQSLPGGVLGDAGRAVRARSQAGLLASGQSVLFERIAGQIGLLIILASGLLLNALSPSGLHWPLGVTTAIGGAFVLGLIILLVALTMRRTAIGRGLARFHHAVLAAPVLSKQANLSIGTAALNISAFSLCATAIGAPLPLLHATALVPMILFAMVLPLSISGWGLREGAAALLFPIAGLSSTAGLAASVAFGLTYLAVTLPGLLMVRRAPNLAADHNSEAKP